MQKINLRDLAGIFNAYQNCIKSNNTEWKDKHEAKIETMLEALPHGSGIDNGVKFDSQRSTPEKLIFTLGFHHMDENGYYDGWTEHELIVTPSLYFGYYMRITGRDRNEIKSYLRDVFDAIFHV